MMPSPGTARSGVRCTPGMVSLTCTSPITSRPAVSVAGKSLSIQQALTSMTTPTPSWWARSTMSRREWTKLMSARSWLVCSTSTGTRVSPRTGSSTFPSATAASSHRSCPADPVVMTTVSAPIVSASVMRIPAPRRSSTPSAVSFRRGIPTSVMPWRAQKAMSCSRERVLVQIPLTAIRPGTASR